MARFFYYRKKKLEIKYLAIQPGDYFLAVYNFQSKSAIIGSLNQDPLHARILKDKDNHPIIIVMSENTKRQIDIEIGKVIINEHDMQKVFSVMNKKGGYTMRRRNVALLVATILFFCLISNAQAQQITRLAFNGWTVQTSSEQKISFYLQITSNQNLHLPTSIRTITITAPDGSVFSLHPVKDWLYPSDPSYWKAFYAADFLGGEIPSGIYKAKVVSISGSSITESDTINASFLPLATITYPSNNATNIPSMLTLKWTRVAGASHYRVFLWDITSNSPIYWDYHSSMIMQTNFTSFALPKGVLKPNHRYTMKIQARFGNQDTDARSESDWVNFTTGSW